MFKKNLVNQEKETIYEDEEIIDEFSNIQSEQEIDLNDFSIENKIKIENVYKEIRDIKKRLIEKDDFEEDKSKFEKNPKMINENEDDLEDEGAKSIILNPDYQRKDVWDNKKRLKFIDSIFIGIPTNPIWLLNKEGESEDSVLDGKQRLRTIFKFLKGKLKIDLNVMTCFKGLKEEEKSKINKKFFKDLPKEIRTNFYDKALLIHRIKITNTSNSRNLAYELFTRLNESSPLQAQEIRNSLYYSKFNTQIKKYVEDNNSIFKKLFMGKNTTKKNYNLRLKNCEIIYRFLGSLSSFNKQNKRYNKFYPPAVRINSFMLSRSEDKLNESKNQPNNKIETLSNNFKESDDFYINILNETMNKVYKVFGENSFRKYEQNKYKPNINVPLTEMQLCSFYAFSEEELSRNKNEIENAYKNLFKENIEFTEGLKYGTGDPSRVTERINSFIKILDNIIN